MRKTQDKYINYERINVMGRHSGFFVVILNPIKSSGVLSMSLEYDKKKTSSGNEDERVLFLDSQSCISNCSEWKSEDVYFCQSCRFRSSCERPSYLFTGCMMKGKIKVQRGQS